jgi:DNA-binding PadR family transcriptional regulator
MHGEHPWHGGWPPEHEGGPFEAEHGERQVIRRRGGPGGPPPPGGHGPFGFRERHRGGWRGGPGWPPGPPGFPFPEPRWRRGPRVKRGDVRAAALSLLAEQPRNGYQIIQEIEARSRGVWRPSPGSVYPALAQLEDEGLIRAQEGEGGRKEFQLTDEGRAYVAGHADELRAPWDALAGSHAEDAIDMRHLFGQVAMAAMQVVSVGTEAQVDAARRVLILARRNLYGILAADEHEAAEHTAGEADPDEGQAGEG